MPSKDQGELFTSEYFTQQFHELAKSVYKSRKKFSGLYYQPIYTCVIHESDIKKKEILESMTKDILSILWRDRDKLKEETAGRFIYATVLQKVFQVLKYYTDRNKEINKELIDIEAELLKISDIWKTS